jgi:hypothetical protein
MRTLFYIVFVLKLAPNSFFPSINHQSNIQHCKCCPTRALAARGPVVIAIVAVADHGGHSQVQLLGDCALGKVTTFHDFVFSQGKKY